MKKYKAIFQLVAIYSFMLMAIFACLRNGNDPDYESYRDIYEKSSLSFEVVVEPAYQFINHLFYSLGFGFQGVIWAFALVAILSKCAVIVNYSERIFLSIIIYICTIYLMFDLIAIRQGLAIAFIMMAIAVLKHNKITSFLLVISASLFHVSALIFIPILLLVGKEYSQRTLIICIAILGLLILSGTYLSLSDYVDYLSFMPDFITDKLEVYISKGTPGGITFKQLMISIVAYIVYIKSRNNFFVRSCCLIYIFGSILSAMFSSVGDIAFRLKWYFAWGEIFFVPQLLNVLTDNVESFARKAFIVVSYFIVFFALYIYPAINFVMSIHNRGYNLIF